LAFTGKTQYGNRWVKAYLQDLNNSNYKVINTLSKYQEDFMFRAVQFASLFLLISFLAMPTAQAADPHPVHLP
jgi:hypothetical protein